MPFSKLKPKPNSPPLPKQDKIDKTYSVDLKNLKLEKKTTYAPRPQPQTVSTTTATTAALVAQQVVETPAGPATTATSTWFAKSWMGTTTDMNMAKEQRLGKQGDTDTVAATTREVVGGDEAEQTTLMSQAAGLGSMVTYVACCAAAGAVFLAGVGAGKYTPNKGGRSEKK